MAGTRFADTLAMASNVKEVQARTQPASAPETSVDLASPQDLLGTYVFRRNGNDIERLACEFLNAES
jgi:hypothetical protein